MVNPIAKRLFNLKEAALYMGRPVWGIRSLIWAGKLHISRMAESSSLMFETSIRTSSKIKQ